MSTPEGLSGNRRLRNREKMVKIRSKKGVKYIPMVDLSGTEEAHQSDIPVDTEGLLEFVHNAPKMSMKEGKRARY